MSQKATQYEVQTTMLVVVPGSIWVGSRPVVQRLLFAETFRQSRSVLSNIDNRPGRYSKSVQLRQLGLC